MTPSSLRKRVLFPILLGFAVLLAAFLVGLNWIQRRNLQEEARADIHAVDTQLRSQLENDAHVMEASLGLLGRDPRLRAAMRAGARDELLQQSLSIFETLRAEHAITHLYFLDTERRTILRTHRPDLHGDVIGRFTTQEAVRTQETVVGLELGRYRGLLTLRVVTPWMVEGELLGYLEMGQEVHSIASYAKTALDLDVVVLLSKERLVREYWETGMDFLERDHDWDHFDSFVIAESTFEETDPAVDERMGEPGRFDGSSLVSIRTAQGQLLGASLPLLDVQNRSVGRLLVFRDVSKKLEDITAATRVIGAVALAVVSILFTFFFFFLDRVAKRLQGAVEARLRSVGIEAAGSGVAMTDLNWGLQWVNPVFEWQSERTREQLLGTSFLDVLRRGAGDEVIHDLTQTILQCKPWRGEVEESSPSGRESTFDLTVTPVQDEGKLQSYVIVRRDITEQREEASELARARDAAIDASMAKSQFLANMSHEIRTPMNGVIGMTGLLLETELTSEQREYAETVRSSGEVLLDLINEVLDFSKIEAGMLEIECIEFDVREIVAEVLDLLGVRARAKQIELVTEVSRRVPRTLAGDPGRLRQILLNLVGNALKFTDSGRVVVRVGVDSADVDLLMLRFEVEDSGVGIDAGAADTLFEAFTQADSSTTRVYGGAGLGLAISRRLCELMGGAIGVESELGKGSLFWFTAHVRRADRPSSQVVRASAARSTAEPVCAGIEKQERSLRVLLAEDNLVNQKVASRILEKLGHRVDAVADGREALDSLGRVPYDLVVMDCQMPVMDGYEASRRIRSSGASYSDIPVVALTAHAMPEDRGRCLEAGMNGYLSKPVHAEDLARVIEECMAAVPVA